jgi:hypothetical protein
MIEIFALVIVAGAIRETARRRGARPWPFVVAAVLAHILSGVLGLLLLGRGPDIMVRWAAVGLVYASTFLLTGQGRRLKSSWQCPECQFFNPPTTLVCPCGYRVTFGGDLP